MRAGDYFGEIAMLYSCPRTATVISNRYTILAKLTKEKFQEIMAEFPEIQ